MKKTGRKFVGERPGFDKNKVRCYNCQQNGHFAKECRNERVERSQNRPAQQNGNGSENRAMVSQQNGGYNQNLQVEEGFEQANLVNIIAEGSDGETGEDQAYLADVNDQLSEVSSELHCNKCDNLSEQLKILTDQYVSLDSQYRTLKEDHHYT